MKIRSQLSTLVLSFALLATLSIDAFAMRPGMGGRPGPGPGFGGRPGPGFGGFHPAPPVVVVPGGGPVFGPRPGWGGGFGGGGWRPSPVVNPGWAWRPWTPARPIMWQPGVGWGGWGNWNWNEMNRISQLEMDAQQLDRMLQNSGADWSEKKDSNEFVFAVQAFKDCLTLPFDRAMGCNDEKWRMEREWNDLLRNLGDNPWVTGDPALSNQLSRTQNAMSNMSYFYGN